MMKFAEDRAAMLRWRLAQQQQRPGMLGGPGMMRGAPAQMPYRQQPWMPPMQGGMAPGAPAQMPYAGMLGMKQGYMPPMQNQMPRSRYETMNMDPAQRAAEQERQRAIYASGGGNVAMVAGAPMQDQMMRGPQRGMMSGMALPY